METSCQSGQIIADAFRARHAVCYQETDTREKRRFRLSTEFIAAEGQILKPDLVPLIQGTVLRDESSLARLYDLVSPIVFGLSLRILGSASAAEETVVDVFSAIRNQTPRFEPTKDSPLAWIITITRACALARRRSAGTVIPIAIEPPRGNLVQRPTAESWLSEDSNRSRRALEALPAELRKPLEMAYFEGLTAEEIAPRLLVSPETISGRIRLGMNQLREPSGPFSDRR